MSNFTDSQPQPYTPYTPQLPIEAMYQIGAERQQMYNQGVQKIQSEINNVAGLDVMRDVDKNYLQSKLNELGNRLTTVAAGDFSNFQLVNSVSGMTNQLIKDKNVQNAVQSTAHIRKQQSLAAQAKKDGKSSPQNEAWLSNQINGYTSSTNLEDTFNGEYVPYTDVGKKLREVADKIHEVDNSIDIPYKRDAQGRTLYYDRSGKVSLNANEGVPKIDDAMLSIKTKGKPAEKILANFYDSLDENDQRQLKIDGWYHYRGANKNTFINDITNNYQQTKEMLNSKILNLNLELQTNTKLSSTQKSALQAEINNANTALTDGSLEKQLQTSISKIDNIQDLDQYKYKLYTQKYLTNLAKDMSYESIQQEYKSNPYKQMEMEGKRLQAEYDKMRQSESHFQQNLAWDKTKFFTEQEAKKKGDGSVGPVTPGRISVDVDTPTLDKLQGEIDNIQGTKTNPGLIDKLNSDNLNNVTGNGLDTPQQKIDYLNKLYSQYSTDPSFINKQTSPDIRKYLEKRRDYDILLKQKIALSNATKKEGKELDEKLDAKLAKEPGLPGLVSAKELFNVKSDFDKLAEELSTTDAYTQSSSGYNLSKFEEKYPVGTRLRAVAEAYIKKARNQPLTSTQQYLINTGDNIYRKYVGEIENTAQTISKLRSDYLAKHMPERQTQEATLSENNKTDMDAVKFAVGDAKSNMQKGGVDVTNKGDFDPDKVEKLMEQKNVSYRVVKNYDGSGIIEIIHGSEIQKVPVNNFAQYFPQYGRNNPLNEIKYSVLSNPNGTTNFTGKRDGSDPVNAGLTGYNIPGIARTSVAPLVRMDVIGDNKNDGSGNDTYIAYLYVNDNGNWKKTLLTPDYVNDATLQTIMSQIGTQTIDDILKK